MRVSGELELPLWRDFLDSHAQAPTASEPSVRALAEHAQLRPHAIAWLIDRGLAGGVVDVLAAALIGGSCGDDLAEVLLTVLGDRDHAPSPPAVASAGATA